MNWGRSLLLLLCAASAMAADELHLRDGSVIVGVYVGGTQKEVYFQHTPAGSDMYPLFMVESVKFNSAPSLMPGAFERAPRPGRSLQAEANPQPRPEMVRQEWASRLKWIVALFLPPQLTAQLSHPAD